MTNLLLLGFLPSGSEWIIIALVILLLFGGKKIPELMRGLGKGVKSFKDGVNEAKDYLSTYGNSTVSRYDTHKKSQLRDTYNKIVKTNKESPLYKIKNLGEAKKYAIDIKESVGDIQHIAASLSSSDQGIEKAFSKKIAQSSELFGPSKRILCPNLILCKNGMKRGMTSSVNTNAIPNASKYFISMFLLLGQAVFLPMWHHCMDIAFRKLM